MRYIVVGGGISGVCCSLELARCLRSSQQGTAQPQGTKPAAHEAGSEESYEGGHQVVLVSSSSVIKGVRDVARLSRLVEELEVVESPLADLAAGSGGLLHVTQGTVTGVDLETRELQLQSGGSLRYDKLCLCTGARPKDLGVPGGHHPAVMSLRDTDSVQELSRRLRGCRRLVLVGNGGIALELAGALLQLAGPTAEVAVVGARAEGGLAAEGGPGQLEAGPEVEATPETPPESSTQQQQGDAGKGQGGEEKVRAQRQDGRAATVGGPAETGLAAAERPELVWVLKHGHIGDAFFDLDAAHFLLQRLAAAGSTTAIATTTTTATTTTATTATSIITSSSIQTAASGAAPDSSPDEQGPAPTPAPAPTLPSTAAQRDEAAVVGGGGSSRRHQVAAPALGHSAGPAWTRELLRGLALAQGPEGGEAGAGQLSGDAGAAPTVATWAPSSVAGVEAGSSAAVVSDLGRSRRPGAVGGEVDGGGGWGGGDGVGGGAFRVVLEFSTTVSSVGDGNVESTEGGEDAEGSEDGGMAGGEGCGGSGGGGCWPARVKLSNGKVYGADLVVYGIGVEPATEWLPPQLLRAADGGLAVGRDMRTSEPHVYAAGDCCTAVWPDGSPHWFQMRLWTQARLMGIYAAHCMLGLADDLASGFNFELFTHVTRFLGYKVVLLGLYNGQRLEGEPANDIRLYSRVAPAADGSGDTFVRVLLLRGRMQGAVLIGETELEEVFENIILDGIDLSMYGHQILDHNIELEHVFD